MITLRADLVMLPDFLVKECTKLVDADRAVVFLFDEKRNELWSKVSMGVTDVIRVDARFGIAGEAFKSGKTINVKDAYRHPKFNPELDKKTGYTTRTILCAPIKDVSGKAIGVLQALNKKDGVFSKEDEEALELFASHVATAIQNAELTGEIEGTQQENLIPKGKVKDNLFASSIIGTSPKIQEAIQLIEKFSNSSISILITGESGTGKELAARTIHLNSSRSNKPFIDINCAALPESLLESELFGIEKGVATGVEKRIGKIETANGGTLFLDEIGDMSLGAQAKLLRVLQEKKLERVGGRSAINVDVRVLAATNKELKNEIEKGGFRKDLYYRLSAVHIHMPALPEMRGDIPHLVNHFLNNFANESGRGSMSFSAGAMDCLVSYGWPGNVRELENEVKRAATLADGEIIEEKDLSEHIRGALGREVLQYAPAAKEEIPQYLRGTVEEIEIQKIKGALERSGGNRQKAAKILGITRTGLIYKIKKYGLFAESKVEIKCQNCGKENPTANELCDGCGQKLNESVKPIKAPKLDEPQSYVPKHLAEKILRNKASLEGERKHVTVLFADIYSSTETSEELDPEEVHILMNRCVEIIIEEVHRYEGIINQFTGDGVMALFGAPLALENHPHGAVSSALAIHRSLNKYGDELKKGRGINLKVRISISTGLVVVGSIGSDLKMDYTVVGDIINLASRLKSLAEPGAILISENTYRLVKDYFSIKPLGELKDEGKGVTLKAYRVLGSGRSTAPLDIASERGLTRFVGRENEINTLRDRLTKAIEGFGQVVVIVGEPGLGKSRLIYEFRKSIEAEKITYLEARCLSYGKSTPYLPVIGILKSNFRVEATDDESVIKEKLDAGIKKMGYSLEWTLPYFHHLLSLREESIKELDEREIKRRTHEAIRAITLKGSQLRPLVLVIENVHWMDSASEEFLNYLVANTARGSIMMIFSSRPGYIPTFTDKSYYTQVTLSPLPHKDCDSILRGLLKADNISDELRESILSKCEGNPFYLEEVVKDFGEEGIIRLANGKYVLSKESSNLRVPGTIHNVIMSRIDRLDQNIKRTLQYASVIGREFALGTLKEIMETGEEIHEYLEKLKELELIYEKGIYPEPEYLFKHALTQEATYNSLLLSKRKELHDSIGKILEKRHRERIEGYYETLAYHFQLGDNKEKALEYLTLAGDKAFRLHSTREARSYYEKAIKLTEELPKNRKNQLTKIDLTLKLVKALRFFESPEQILKLLKGVEEFARTLGDQKALAEILSSMGFFTVILGKNQEEGISYGEKCLEIANKLGDQRLIASAYYSLSLAYYFTREIPKAIEIMRKSYALNKKTGNFFEASHSFLILSASYWHGGDYRGIECLQEVRKLAKEWGVPTMAAHTYCCHGAYGIFYGNIKECIKDCQKAMEMFKDLGDVYYDLISSGCYWYAHYKNTKEKDALKHLEEIIKIKEEKNMWIWQPMHYSFLAEIYIDLNNLEEAFKYSQRAIDIAQKAGNKLEEGRAWIVLGNAYLKKRDWQKAEESFKESIKPFNKIGANSGLGMSYYNLGAMYRDLGRNEESKKYLLESLAISNKAGLSWYLERSKEALAELESP